ncbi:hypothetical protein P8452_08643 [Trifolium repens]|nr:hypothetical protein P8452_08643 [Trifolium repens]
MKLKLVLVGPAKISYNNSNLTSLFCSTDDDNNTVLVFFFFLHSGILSFLLFLFLNLITFQSSFNLNHFLSSFSILISLSLSLSIIGFQSLSISFYLTFLNLIPTYLSLFISFSYLRFICFIHLLHLLTE